MQLQQIQQPQAPQPSSTIGDANGFIVTGCTNPTVGAIAQGNCDVVAENHGRRAYKRDTQVNGLDVMVYFWDERDGPNFCGWWFGPKIGGDQVWAYHPDKTQTPPRSGWKVPYDGAVDPTMILTPSSQASAMPQQGQQQQMQQQQMQQQQMQQQMQQQQMQQQQQWQQQQQMQQQQMQQQQLMMQQKMQQQQLQQQNKLRLEENKRKLEEANRSRLQAQQQKMAELRAK